MSVERTTEAIAAWIIEEMCGPRDDPRLWAAVVDTYWAPRLERRWGPALYEFRVCVFDRPTFAAAEAMVDRRRRRGARSDARMFWRSRRSGQGTEARMLMDDGHGGPLRVCGEEPPQSRYMPSCTITVQRPSRVEQIVRVHHEERVAPTAGVMRLDYWLTDDVQEYRILDDLTLEGMA